MKRFALTTKNGEVINTSKAIDLQDAIEKFAKIKQLTIETLLEIFKVEIFIR
jgi:hypothetical protein